MLECTQKLVKLIEKEECLWNSCSEVYLHRKLKVDAWRRIAKQLTSNWNEISQESQNKIIIGIQRKWINIRIHYKREILNHKQLGHFCKKGADLLKFLDPVLTTERDSSIIPPRYAQNRFINADKTSALQRRHTNALRDVRPQSSLSRQETSDQLFTLNTQPKRKRTDNLIVPNQNRSEDLSDNAMERITDQIKLTTDYLATNPNLAFLLSFTHDMEVMSSMQRIGFKSGVIDLIKLIKYPPNKDLD